MGWISWLVQQPSVSYHDDDSLASVFAEELSSFRNRFHFDDFNKRANCFCRQYLYARALRLITSDWDSEKNCPAGKAFFSAWPGYSRLKSLERLAKTYMMTVLNGRFVCVEVIHSFHSVSCRDLQASPQTEEG